MEYLISWSTSLIEHHKQIALTLLPGDQADKKTQTYN